MAMAEPRPVICAATSRKIVEKGHVYKVEAHTCICPTLGFTNKAVYVDRYLQRLYAMT